MSSLNPFNRNSLRLDKFLNRSHTLVWDRKSGVDLIFAGNNQNLNTKKGFSLQIVFVMYTSKISGFLNDNSRLNQSNLLKK